jgi:glycosyltransferase involved in cell wall biosynthesis
LDAYQGWEDLVVALSLVSRSIAEARLLVATESSPIALMDLARQHGVASRVRVAPLHDELSRQRAHAAADLCLVPRRVEGGLPIKLLEALSRDVAIVAVPAALAGLPLDPCVLIATEPTPEAIAATSVIALKDRALRVALSTAGSAYLREQHSPSKFFAAFDTVCGR